MTDKLRQNATLVDTLGSAVRSEESVLATGPQLLKRILEQGAWREFVTKRGEHIQHTRYADFVTAAPLKGIGTTMELIDRLVGTDDGDLLRLHKAAKSLGQGHRSDLGELPGESTGSYGAARSDYTADRLHREHPEQYAAYQAGEKKLNAAAVDAGIRSRRTSIRLDDAESAAGTLRKHMDSTVLAHLIKILLEEIDP
ncbi:MAG TPA: hypothetical protein VH084_08740 [Mycobacterium sp.]|nr:hypothetical protein [Mycobacterium sp.]